MKRQDFRDAVEYERTLTAWLFWNYSAESCSTNTVTQLWSATKQDTRTLVFMKGITGNDDDDDDDDDDDVKIVHVFQIG